jgi:hypothetical protein
MTSTEWRPGMTPAERLAWLYPYHPRGPQPRFNPDLPITPGLGRYGPDTPKNAKARQRYANDPALRQRKSEYVRRYRAAYHAERLAYDRKRREEAAIAAFELMTGTGKFAGFLDGLAAYFEEKERQL